MLIFKTFDSGYGIKYKKEGGKVEEIIISVINWGDL